MRSARLDISIHDLFYHQETLKLKKKKFTWCRDRALNETFPRLYTMAHRKDAAVADLMGWRADQIVWDISFYKALHDWEQGMLINYCYIALWPDNFGP